VKAISLRIQLLALAAICVALFAGLGTLVITGSRSDAAALRALYVQGLQPLLALQDIDRQLREVRFRLAGVLLEQIPVQGSRNHLADTRQSVPALWKRYVEASHAREGATREMLDEIRRGLDRFSAFASELETAYASDNRSKLADLLEDDWPQVHLALLKPLERLLPVAVSEADSLYTEQSAAASRRQTLAALGLLFGVSVLALFLLLFHRRLSRALRDIVASMRRLARGDLAVQLDDRSSAETAMISAEFTLAARMLSALVSRIHGIAARMQAASREVALEHTALSERTTQQAASLEETAASMEEMTATVAQNAENARRAASLSEEAASTASRGGEAVGAAVRTMAGVSDSSKKVGEIVGVIDGIAFQTNILALNAAVEAARAGEQGRGFAVVASEVRGLAKRSAEAAREIRDLIKASTAQFDAGSAQVMSAGETMKEVVASVHRVHALISEISGASGEQAKNVAQMNLTLQQLETVTHQNATMVGERSADTMEEHATALAEAVGDFTLAAGAPGAGNAVANSSADSHPALPVLEREGVAPETDGTAVAVRGRRSA